jgi:hypothetical protein
MCFGKEVLKRLFCRHRENSLDVSERKYLLYASTYALATDVNVPRTDSKIQILKPQMFPPKGQSWYNAVCDTRSCEMISVQHGGQIDAHRI